LDQRTDVIVQECTTPFRGFNRVDILHLLHRRFDGTWSPPIHREVIVRSRAVAVLPYEPRTDRIVLIEQFRPGALVAGEPAWMIEIVAGGMKPGETAEAVARREALEEAGIAVTTLEPIASFGPSPGILSEWVDLFCGRIDQFREGVFGESHENEDIRAFAAPAAEAVAMLRRGEIANAPAIIALQWFAANREELRARWLDAAGPAP
jgi:ADP-ribose pyrophosphatase